jgi:hypothetical protein
MLKNFEGSESEYPDVTIDAEMIRCVEEYVEYVESIFGDRETEQKLETDWNSIYGTADVVVNDWPDTLHVIDLKYGQGNQVDPVDNPQLAIYALGALKRFGDDFETIKMHIFQPRGEGPTVKTWEQDVLKFQRKWHKKIDKAVKEIHDKPKLYRPGAHCKWCKGAKDCPTVKRATEGIARNAEKDIPVPKDVKALARLLGKEAAVLEYFNACKAAAFELLSKGQKVPGFKLVQTYGRKTWTDQDAVIAKLENHFGIALDPDWCAPKKLKTPAQLRKELKKAYPAEQLDDLTLVPKRGLKLVPETDKRPAHEGAAAEFSNVEEN